MTNLPNNLDTFQRVSNNTRSENAHTDLHNNLADAVEAIEKYSGSNIVLELPVTSEVNRVYTLKQTHQGKRPGIYICTQADPAEYLNVGGVQPKANGGLRFDGQELEVESTDGSDTNPQTAGYLIGGTNHSDVDFKNLTLKIAQTTANVADIDDHLASRKKGQSFTTGASGYINEFKLLLKRGNNLSSTLPAYIYAVDADGIPTGSPLFTGSFNYLDVGTTPTWISFPCYLQLSPNTKYALVINMPGSGSSYPLRWNGSNSGHSGGDWLYFDGTTWTKNSDKARAFIVGTKDDNDGKIKINIDGTVYDDVHVNFLTLDSAYSLLINQASVQSSNWLNYDSPISIDVSSPNLKIVEYVSFYVGSSFNGSDAGDITVDLIQNGNVIATTIVRPVVNTFGFYNAYFNSPVEIQKGVVLTMRLSTLTDWSGARAWGIYKHNTLGYARKLSGKNETAAIFTSERTSLEKQTGWRDQYASNTTCGQVFYNSDLNYLTKIKLALANTLTYGNVYYTVEIREGIGMSGAVLASKQMAQSATNPTPAEGNVFTFTLDVELPLTIGNYYTITITADTNSRIYYSTGSLYSNGSSYIGGVEYTDRYFYFELVGFGISLTEIAASLQTAIRNATGKIETVVYDTDHFVITSSTANRDSKILKLMTPTSGTDLSGRGTYPYFDMAENATEVLGAGDEGKLLMLDKFGNIISQLRFEAGETLIVNDLLKISNGKLGKIVGIKNQITSSATKSGTVQSVKWMTAEKAVMRCEANLYLLNFSGDTISSIVNITPTNGSSDFDILDENKIVSVNQYWSDGPRTRSCVIDVSTGTAVFGEVLDNNYWSGLGTSGSLGFCIVTALSPTKYVLGIQFNWSGGTSGQKFTTLAVSVDGTTGTASGGVEVCSDNHSSFASRTYGGKLLKIDATHFAYFFMTNYSTSWSLPGSITHARLYTVGASSISGHSLDTDRYTYNSSNYKLVYTTDGSRIFVYSRSDGFKFLGALPISGNTLASFSQLAIDNYNPTDIFYNSNNIYIQVGATIYRHFITATKVTQTPVETRLLTSTQFISGLRPSYDYFVSFSNDSPIRFQPFLLDTFEFVTIADNVYETGDIVNIQSSLKHAQALKGGTYYVAQDGQSLTITPTNNKLIGRCIENNYLVQG